MSWEVETIVGKAFVIEWEADCVVCEVSPAYRRQAALLAAAPDLLAALKEARTYMDLWTTHNIGSNGPKELAALIQIEAALAKAEAQR